MNNRDDETIVKLYATTFNSLGEIHSDIVVAEGTEAEMEVLRDFLIGKRTPWERKGQKVPSIFYLNR